MKREYVKHIIKEALPRRSSIEKTTYKVMRIDFYMEEQNDYKIPCIRNKVVLYNSSIFTMN